MPQMPQMENSTLMFFLFCVAIGCMLTYYLLKIRNRKVIITTREDTIQPIKQPSSVRRYHMV